MNLFIFLLLFQFLTVSLASNVTVKADAQPIVVKPDGQPKMNIMVKPDGQPTMNIMVKPDTHSKLNAGVKPDAQPTMNITVKLDLLDPKLRCTRGDFCWPKCCGNDSVMNLVSKACEKLNLTMEPEVVKLDINGEKILMESINPVKNLKTLYSFGRPMIDGRVCVGGIVSFRKFNHIIRLSTDGKLVTSNGKTVEIYDEGFCIENFVDQSRNLSVLSVLLCSPLPPVFRTNASDVEEKKPLSCVQGFDRKVDDTLIHEL